MSRIIDHAGEIWIPLFAVYLAATVILGIILTLRGKVLLEGDPATGISAFLYAAWVLSMMVPAAILYALTWVVLGIPMYLLLCAVWIWRRLFGRSPHCQV